MSAMTDLSILKLESSPGRRPRTVRAQYPKRHRRSTRLHPEERTTTVAALQNSRSPDTTTVKTLHSAVLPTG
jgi:hypothetical protein